jgi:hypothetical protein
MLNPTHPPDPEHSFFMPAAVLTISSLGMTAVDAKDATCRLSCETLWSWWKRVAVVSEVTRDVYGHECELRSLQFLSHHGFPCRRPPPALPEAFPPEVPPASVTVAEAVAVRVCGEALTRVLLLPPLLHRRASWTLAHACHMQLLIESFRYRAYAVSMDFTPRQQKALVGAV